jgi:hypothetical protein
MGLAEKVPISRSGPLLALGRRRLRRYERAPGISTERNAQDVQIVLEVGDGLREPVQPPDDELLVHAAAVHVLEPRLPS